MEGDHDARHCQFTIGGPVRVIDFLISVEPTPEQGDACLRQFARLRHEFPASRPSLFCEMEG
jgi:hypothetical protein